MVVLVAGCGLPLHHLVRAPNTRPETTGAVLEAAGPLALTVTPLNAAAGASFHLRLTGLVATDVVTFAIAAQGGHPYVGPPHTPDSSGSISAVYETSESDTLGLYVVLAHTASGRGVYATFHVDPPTSSAAQP